MLQLDAAPLSMPIFYVRLEHQSAGASDGKADDSGRLARVARLSLREREVAMLVGQGCSNDEAARRLGKSVLTVKKQMRSIYEKLEIENRGRLIALLR
jgi:DNA-binding CsgD family transcriptional regulator